MGVCVEKAKAFGFKIEARITLRMVVEGEPSVRETWSVPIPKVEIGLRLLA
jgi:hypothetical protein